jgi:hypothetical protein
MRKIPPITYVEYIETPRRCDVPVKIDKILEERMKAFLKARHLKRSGF